MCFTVLEPFYVHHRLSAPCQHPDTAETEQITITERSGWLTSVETERLRTPEVSASFRCERWCRSSPPSASAAMEGPGEGSLGALALSLCRTWHYGVQLEGEPYQHLHGCLSALGLLWCDRNFLNRDLSFDFQQLLALLLRACPCGCWGGGALPQSEGWETCRWANGEE